MLKVDFMDVCEEALKLNKGIVVEFDLPNLVSPEIIINPAENVLAKMNYYEMAYGNFMELNANPLVRVIDIELLKEQGEEGVVDND